MYADYTFYTTSYYGNKIKEADWPKYGTKASDFMDFATCDSLRDNMPTDTTAQDKIKKATCAVADAMKDIDDRKAITASAGTASGAIKSISSGGESITYQSSRIDEIITAGEAAIREYLYQAMHLYMSNVTDDTGRLYIYEGID